jgi:hypothetical protein
MDKNPQHLYKPSLSPKQFGSYSQSRFNSVRAKKEESLFLGLFLRPVLYGFIGFFGILIVVNNLLGQKLEYNPSTLDYIMSIIGFVVGFIFGIAKAISPVSGFLTSQKQTPKKEN